MGLTELAAEAYQEQTAFAAAQKARKLGMKRQVLHGKARAFCERFGAAGPEAWSDDHVVESDSTTSWSWVDMKVDGLWLRFCDPVDDHHALLLLRRYFYVGPNRHEVKAVDGYCASGPTPPYVKITDLPSLGRRLARYQGTSPDGVMGLWQEDEEDSDG